MEMMQNKQLFEEYTYSDYDDALDGLIDLIDTELKPFVIGDLLSNREIADIQNKAISYAKQGKGVSIEIDLTKKLKNIRLLDHFIKNMTLKVNTTFVEKGNKFIIDVDTTLSITDNRNRKTDYKG